MKIFLQILLYLICSECRIDDGPVEKVEFNVLGSGQVDYKYKNHRPITLKDLNDYTNFYQEFYGTYPGYTDFDFTKYMIVIVFVSNTDVEDIYETNEQISIHMLHPKPQDYSHLYPVSYCQVVEPQNHYVAISIKRSDKAIKAYD